MWDTEPEEAQFRIRWAAAGTFPSSAETCRVATPSLLRPRTRMNSFGHMLRDNLAPLAYVPARLGRPPEAYQWVQWPSDINGNDQVGNTFRSHHYSLWAADHPIQSWGDLLEACDHGACLKSHWFFAH